MVKVQRKYHHVGIDMNSDNEHGNGDNAGSEEDNEEEPLAGIEMHEGSEQKRESLKKPGKKKRKKKRKKKQAKEGHKQPELV